MVDVRRKIVIIHPPKTGGTSVQLALLGNIAYETGAGVLRHDPFSTIVAKMAQVKTWRRAILVRNPFARLESLYFYAKGHRWQHNGVWRRQANGTAKSVVKTESFEAWVEREEPRDWFTERYAPEGLQVWPMWRYVEDWGAQQIHLEDIETELPAFLGETIELPRIRVSKRSAVCWSEAMITKVQRWFCLDFELFGYPIGGPV